ncbi:MAG: rhomboid family intramembrane serine protease [Rubricoccaceae bacterium]
MLLDTPVVAFLLILNGLTGAYTLLVDGSLVGRWAFRPAEAHREWYRWLTAGFVHVGFGHLLFNLLTLFFLGPPVELQLGAWRFLALYVGSDLAANALTYWRHRQNPAYSAVGASGAIAGVVFAFCLFRPLQPLYFMFIPVGIPAIVFAFAYLALSAYAAQQGGGRIAHEAHLGGALGGLALTILLYPAAVGIFLRGLGL